MASTSAIIDTLQDFDLCGLESKKECKKYMYDIWSDATESDENRGFLVVYPYNSCGTGRFRLGLWGPHYDK